MTNDYVLVAMIIGGREGSRVDGKTMFMVFYHLEPGSSCGPFLMQQLYVVLLHLSAEVCLHYNCAELALLTPPPYHYHCKVL